MQRLLLVLVAVGFVGRPARAQLPGEPRRAAAADADRPVAAGAAPEDRAAGADGETPPGTAWTRLANLLRGVASQSHAAGGEGADGSEEPAALGQWWNPFRTQVRESIANAHSDATQFRQAFDAEIQGLVQDAKAALGLGDRAPPAQHRDEGSFWRLPVVRLRPPESFGVAAYSDLASRPELHIYVVTLACIPWYTGTSVNPLLRAAYLAKDRPAGKVTLLVPWVGADQHLLYGAGQHFSNESAQEKFVLDWVRGQPDLGGAAADRLAVAFFPAVYSPERGSIFPVGDIMALIPASRADVAILEEPEHLTWEHRLDEGGFWANHFRYSVCVIHTNYLYYGREFGKTAGEVGLLELMNKVTVRANCHRVIKLSDAVQDFMPAGREVTSAIHGVAPLFLKLGRARLVGPAPPPVPFTNAKPPYFIGKIAKAKVALLLDGIEHWYARHPGGEPERSEFHIFGDGPDLAEMQEKARAIERRAAPGHAPKIVWRGRLSSHALLSDHKVFVNPSLSEVLCTTSIEALAMGHWVVLPRHESNAFMMEFPNCLAYDPDNLDEFAGQVDRAMGEEPPLLSPEELERLSWGGATARLMAAAAVPVPVHARGGWGLLRPQGHEVAQPDKTAQGLARGFWPLMQALFGDPRVREARRALRTTPTGNTAAMSTEPRADALDPTFWAHFV